MTINLSAKLVAPIVSPVSAVPRLVKVSSIDFFYILQQLHITGWLQVLASSII